MCLAGAKTLPSALVALDHISEHEIFISSLVCAKLIVSWDKDPGGRQVMGHKA